MIRWTESAKARLDRYFAGVRQTVVASGADADEVADDLRRHVLEEVEAQNLSVVTERDVEKILARVGAPETGHKENLQEAVAAEKPIARPTEGPRTIASGLLLAFGVLLPFGTIIFEFLTGASAGVLFDPLPTPVHAVLTLLVPLANLALWTALRGRDLMRYTNRLAWINSVALGISLVYAVLFIPVTPFAVIGILVYGLGLVPLSPISAFICAALLRYFLRRAVGKSLPGLWVGSVAGVMALTLFTAPLLITKISLGYAVSESMVESKRGVYWLRVLGDEEELLRACYGRVGRSGEMYAFGKRVNPEEARGVYYRVTGQPFNSVPPPKLYAGRARWSVLEKEFTWDNDQGGDAVAGRVKGLSLTSSRQDGVVDPDAGLAYLEWTLEFRNESRLQREARAQIALPPGAVVSRLTLWIDGEEREAAFGGRSQVKMAYKQVVQKRRDPVLVTTCGPDRVLIQCFPVAPEGGRMKVRLGITAPLILTNTASGCLKWPHFLERNFTIPENFQHALWVDSPRRISTTLNKLVEDRAKPGQFNLRGSLRELDLSSPSNMVRVERDPQILNAWTPDSRGPGGGQVQQRIFGTEPLRPDRVVIVIDGNERLIEYYRSISDSLTSMPPGIEFAVLLARDGAEELVPLLKVDAVNLEAGAARVGRIRSTGGHDNVAALVRAWDLAAQAERGIVVWIHGNQPVLLDNVEQLRQRLERQAGHPRLFAVPVESGPNRVLERLDGIKAVEVFSRLAPLGDDLRRLFTQLQEEGIQFQFHRRRFAAGEGTVTGYETSLHLARLWAADEVARLHRSRRDAEGLALAGTYQLVTPVSGAVVLETQAQYDQAGLEPVAPDSVPAVPEPSAAMLLLVAFGLTAWTRRWKRRIVAPVS